MSEAQIKEVIKSKIDRKNAPGLLRLAFHDSGTFCKHSATGGVNGSIALDDEIKREENDGLQGAVTLVKSIKESLPNVSMADIIAVAGAVAVEICGGPIISVQLNRKDSEKPSPEGRLPNENDDVQCLKSSFDRMGLTLKDLVALSGAHTIGDAKDKPFTDDRLTFNNSYFKNLMNPSLPNHLGRFKSDLSLLDNEFTLDLVKKYAENEQFFFADFVDSDKKMTELGRSE